MDVFHAGEQAVQERMGVRDQIAPWAARVVRSVLPEQHRQFYGGLPFVVAAARDEAGWPWATILAGRPGFACSPDPRTLRIATRPGPGDALEHALRPGVDVGLLGIELATRRRNRVNGRVRASPGGDLVLDVVQAFGNCPQHITVRQWRWVEPEPVASARRVDRLDPELRAWISGADTLFIATGHRGADDEPSSGMDASHRGGPPGFIEVVDERTLVIPDYAGNNYYNTVGNLVMDARAGITLVDFRRGGLLQLTGRVEIDWDSPRVPRYPGAQRLLVFELEHGVVRERALPLRWEEAGGAVRPLRLVQRVRESDDVQSLLFEAHDGAALASFTAGQHLPLELRVPGHDRPIRRSYSLSGHPEGPQYRISVKCVPGGLASGYLHTLRPGAIVAANEPAGDFVVEPGERPLLLVSGGVGITPLLAMLHALVHERDPRPVVFVHGARDGRHHPFAAEVDQLIAGRGPARRVFAYSRPRPEDRLGEGFDHVGRIDVPLLESLVSGLDADIYLCGPTGLMEGLRAQLEARGVAASRVFTESFGAAGSSAG